MQKNNWKNSGSLADTPLLQKKPGRTVVRLLSRPALLQGNLQTNESYCSRDTSAADNPLSVVIGVYSIRWPVFRVLYPSPLRFYRSVIYKGIPGVSRKPMPFSSLNHFTVACRFWLLINCYSVWANFIDDLVALNLILNAPK